MAPAGRISAAVDLQARVALAHASVDSLATATGVDLLHVKGPALDPALRSEHRFSTDADVLVRPSHVDALVTALREHGWRLVTDFRNGSVFEHAANYHHEQWGYADVHRSFPGVSSAADAAFDLLWADRRTTEVAHRPVPVPAPVDQALLLCLHAARGGLADPRGRADLEQAWDNGGPAHQAAVRARGTALGADVALAAALGELDTYTGPGLRDVPLWRHFSLGGDRTDELVARLRAAPDRRTRAEIAWRALRVNREFAAMELGHRPTRRELASLQAGRVVTAAREVAGRLRRTGRAGR